MFNGLLVSPMQLLPSFVLCVSSICKNYNI